MELKVQMVFKFSFQSLPGGARRGLSNHKVHMPFSDSVSLILLLLFLSVAFVDILSCLVSASAADGVDAAAAVDVAGSWDSFDDMFVCHYCCVALDCGKD